jgi:ferrous iron transport protein A
MPMPETVVPLSQLPLNGTARVVEIVGDDAIACRLMEMGITEGEPVQSLGAALFGDPLEYLVRGYRLSLRRSEADRVRVCPET